MREHAGLDDIDRVEVKPAPRWMSRMWRGGVSGMTLPWGIFVKPEVLAGDSVRLANLINHELIHVRQWRDLGVSGFVRRYLAEYLRGRLVGHSHGEAYAAISFEREARRVAGH